eukprot:COSAG06_NODE_335_length_17284_cov_12.707594_7_plen_105_part_00
MESGDQQTWLSAYNAFFRTFSVASLLTALVSLSFCRSAFLSVPRPLCVRATLQQQYRGWVDASYTARWHHDYGSIATNAIRTPCVQEIELRRIEPQQQQEQRAG